MGRKSPKGKFSGNSTVWNKSRERNPNDPTEAENDMKSKLTGKQSNKHRNNRRLSQDKDNHGNYDSDQSVFPEYGYWVVFAWTLILRVWYVTNPANWWILHPDEVYQTIEVAHTDAFGYGFRTYEYLPPPGNSTYSGEHAWSAEKGMYSLRSFMLVKLLSVVMVIAERVGVSSSPFLVIKVFHAVVTSCLPVSVYMFSKALYRSRDVAVMASVLTSISLTLNVFGTHTFINSFLSPFVFISLTPVANALSSSLLNSHRRNNQIILTVPSSATEKLSSDMNGSIGKQPTLNGITPATNQHFNKSSQINGSVPKENGHIQTNGHIPNGRTMANGSIKGDNKTSRSWVNYIYSFFKDVSRAVENRSNITTGYINGDINAYIVKKKPQSSDTMTLTNAAFKTENNAHLSANDHIIYLCHYSRIRGFVYGVLLGVSLYSRTDMILVPTVICVLYVDSILKNLYSFICDVSYYVLGICVGIFIGGYVDLMSYGVGFITVRQWFKFNVQSGLSSFVFGEESKLFYLYKLFENEPLFLFVCFILVVDIIVFLTSFTDQKSKSSTYGNDCVNRNISFAFFMLILTYSLIGHKEYRFICNALVILYISLARAVYVLCRTGLQFVFPENQNKNQYYIYLSYSLLTVVLSSHIYTFLSMNTSSLSKWTYSGQIDADVNQCMNFIRNQNDVNGIFMDRSIYTMGGYSLIHKNVPLFALNRYEFVEYDKDSFFNDSRYFAHTVKEGFFVPDRISEFVSIYNTPHVVKILIEKSQYNYVVLNPERSFLDVGYSEIFRTKQAIVLKRKFTDTDEKELEKIAQRTPMGNNATILEYEGERLKHFGLFKKAEYRLVWSNHINKKRPGPFQILLEMFKYLGETKKYNNILGSCMEVFRKEECMSPHRPIRMHQEYYRKKTN